MPMTMTSMGERRDVDMDELSGPRRHAVRWLEAGCFLAACLCLAALGGSSDLPRVLPLLLFTSLLFAAENTSVLLPSTARMSPGVMVIMAAITAYSSRGAVLGGA